MLRTRKTKNNTDINSEISALHLWRAILSVIVYEISQKHLGRGHVAAPAGFMWGKCSGGKRQ